MSTPNPQPPDVQPPDVQPPDVQPPDVTGLPVAEAEARCRADGWEIVRVLDPGAIITLEFRPNRVNLTVDDGVVTRVHAG